MFLLAALLCGSRGTAQTGAGSPNRGNQDRVAQLFAQAAQEINSGEYSAAIDTYKSALSIQPDSPQALSNLGVAYHLAGRFPEAVETLKKALKLNPEGVPANLILGMDLIRLGKPQEALPPLQKVLKRDPHHRDALLAEASAYFALHDFDSATRVYQTEVTVRPDDVDAWYGLGLCFEHLAETTTRQMAKLDAASSYYHRLVGEYLTEQAQEIDAEEALRLALKSAGAEDEGLHAALGFAHLRLGLIDQADQDFETELQLHRGNLEGQLGLAAVALGRSDCSAALNTLCVIYQADSGFLLSQMGFLVASLDGDTQNRVTTYLANNTSRSCPVVRALLQTEIASPGRTGVPERAFEVSPAERGPGTGTKAPGSERPPAAGASAARTSCLGFFSKLPGLSMGEALELAQCSFLSGRFLVSLRAAQLLLSRESSSGPGLFWQAEASRRLAQAAFEKAVQLNADSWQGNILIADIYRQRDKWDEAIQHYRAAAELNPSSPAPYLGLATVCWQTGEFEQAETALQKVLELDPENAQANFELGDINVRLRRFGEAVPYLRKALAQNPDWLSAHADLGKCLANTGAVSEAITELTEAEPADRFGDIHYELFRLYKNQGKTDLAQKALVKSEELRKLESQTQSSRLRQAAEAATRRNQETPQQTQPHD
jgi:tetratricopeptide (TPR) repeat protein